MHSLRCRPLVSSHCTYNAATRRSARDKGKLIQFQIDTGNVLREKVTR